MNKKLWLSGLLLLNLVSYPIVNAESRVIEIDESIEYTSKSVELNGETLEIPNDWSETESSDSQVMYMTGTSMVSFEMIDDPGVSIEHPVLTQEIMKSFEQDESMKVINSEVVEIEGQKAIHLDIQALDFLTDPSSDYVNAEIIIFKLNGQCLMAMRLQMDDSLDEEVVKADQDLFYKVLANKITE